MKPYVLLSMLSFLVIGFGCSDGNLNEDPAIDDTVVVDTDPLLSNTVLVNFDITVPAYQSNDLKIIIDGVGSEVLAEWVSGELWLASAELPASTEHQLSVSFFGLSGGIRLGTYEAPFITGVNAFESLVITANDFKTLHDLDGDGDSNIEELKAGGNPFVNGYIGLDQGEVREKIYIPLFHQLTIMDLEAKLPKERPFFEEAAYQQFDALITEKTMLDELGTGSVTYIREYEDSVSTGYRKNVYSRINNGESVIWSQTRESRGGLLESGPESAQNTEGGFKVTTTVTGDQSRDQKGEEFGSGRNGDKVYSSNFGDYQLTGYKLQGNNAKWCDPVSGSINRTVFWRGATTLMTIRKQLDDQYWKVTWLHLATGWEDQYWVKSIGSFYCNLADQ